MVDWVLNTALNITSQMVNPFSICDANFTFKKISSYKFVVAAQLIPWLNSHYVYATIIDYTVCSPWWLHKHNMILVEVLILLRHQLSVLICYPSDDKGSIGKPQLEKRQMTVFLLHSRNKVNFDYHSKRNPSNVQHWYTALRCHVQY